MPTQTWTPAWPIGSRRPPAALPLGSSLSEAQAFFSARGTTLLCCVRMPPQAERHYVLERRLGQGFMREYDLAVLVEFSPAGHVASLSVQRWGVGW